MNRPTSSSRLPTGTVTFLFTDIEGSTRLLQDLGETGFKDALEAHNELIRETVTDGGGVVVRTIGDAFFAVFEDPVAAVSAAADAQRLLAKPVGRTVLAVRMGLHTGRGVVGGDDYVGIDVHRAARIADAGHGGQILLSGTTAALVGPHLPTGVSLRALGEFRLKDLSEAEQVQQAVIEGLRDEFPPLRTVDAVAGNLPVQLTSFVGRVGQLEEVKALLGRARVVTLTGPGGTGKTRLAIQVAAQTAHDFADGAFFVPLETISDASLVAPEILATLGLTPSPSIEPEQHLAGYLGDREMLLVLDNLEQIEGAGTPVARMLTAAPRLTVVATSRIPLHISGEQEFPVPPLSVADDGRREGDVGGSESVELFTERALAVRPDLVLDEDTLAIVGALTARLDGLPLAIELAASRVKALAPDAILERLSNRLLVGSASDAPERQQTITNAIGWSYDLLDEPLRRVFEDCSVFMGGATLEFIEQVTDPANDVVDGVSTLVDHSLLRLASTDAGARYQMLVVVREFAYGALVARGDDDAVRRRHAAAYATLAHAAAPHLLTEASVAWLDRLAADHDNIRAALDWCVETENTDVALRLIADVWRFWQFRGHLVEAAERIDSVLALRGGDPRSRALALEARAGVAYWQGRWEESLAPYEAALGLLREHGSDAEIANALFNASFPIGFAGDRERAHAYLEESRALAEAAGDRLGVGRALWGLGDQAHYVGDWPTIVHYITMAEEVFAGLDAPYDLGWARFMLAESNYALGNLTEARQYHAAGLAGFARVGDQSAMVLFLRLKAAILLAEGAEEQAGQLLGAADAITERSGAAIGEVSVNEYDGVRGLLEDTPPAVAAAIEVGRSLTLDEAVALAISS